MYTVDGSVYIKLFKKLTISVDGKSFVFTRPASSSEEQTPTEVTSMCIHIRGDSLTFTRSFTAPLSLPEQPAFIAKLGLNICHHLFETRTCAPALFVRGRHLRLAGDGWEDGRAWLAFNITKDYFV